MRCCPCWRSLTRVLVVLVASSGCATKQSTTTSAPKGPASDPVASPLRLAPPRWHWHEQPDAHFDLLIPDGLQPTVQWFGEPAIAMQLDAEAPDLLVRVELYPIEGVPDPASNTDYHSVVERIAESFDGQLGESTGVERDGNYGVAVSLGYPGETSETRIGQVLAFPIGGFEYRVWLWGAPAAVVDARPVLDGFRFRDSIDGLVMGNVPPGRAYWLLGDAAAQREDYVVAERYFAAALREKQLTYADREAIGTRLVDLFTNTDRTDDAVELVGAMKDGGTWSVELRLREAWLRLRRREPALAVELYRGLLVDGHDEDAVAMGLALALVGESQAAKTPNPETLSEAQAILTEALSRSWPAPSLRLAHAVVQFAKADAAGAAADVERAVAWLGLPAIGALGLHLEMAGIDAATFGSEILAALPNRPEAPDNWRTRAILATLMDDTAGHTHALEELTVLAPRDALAWYDLGRLRRVTGDHRGALEALDRAWALAPDNTAIANQLAWHLATAPDHAVRDGARASRIADTLLAIDHLPAWQLDTVAAARAEAGDFEAAVTIERVTIERKRRHRASDEDIKEYRQHLDSYRRRQPWREDPLAR